MKVVHVLKTSTGATWALRQMRELVRLGLDVHVILPDGPLVPAYTANGITTHIFDASVSVKNPFKNLKVFAAFRGLIDNIHPDIVHSHFVSTTLTMRLALGSKHYAKRVFQVPGPLHLEHAFYKSIELLSADDNDFWLASCEWTRNKYLSDGLGSSRVGLSYYGVDISSHEFLRTGKLRGLLGISEDIPLIGNVSYFYAPKFYLGQARGIKGHEDLIDAVDHAAQSIPNLTCVFIGGPWANGLKYMNKVIKYAKAKTYGRFYFLGYRDDVQELYPDLDLAVHPSLSENLGGAGESMLCGVPTVTTNVGGFPDIVKNNQTGWLVPKSNPKELSSAIYEAFNSPDLMRQYALNGQMFARSLLDVKENALDVYEFYNQMIN